MGQVIEQLKKFWNSLKEFWAKQDKKKRIKIIAGIIALIAVIALLVVWMNQPKYATLYSGLGADEQNEIEKYLAESTSTKYKIEGNTIYVEESSEESIRMELAKLGHPYSTPNYDFYFDKVDTLTTAEERKLVEEYQLNQRLADVIKTIDGVKSATVTIAYPETSSYVLSTENKENITAGVTVSLKGGTTLSDSQVAGIQTLVSTSVPGLKSENVSVINTATGEALAGASSSGGSTIKSTMDASTLKMDVENAYENEIQSKVLSVLQPIYGASNVRVTVKCSINIDDSIKEVATYMPSEDNRGVITSEDLAKAIQNDGQGVSGTTGTDTNAQIAENEDLTTYPSITAGDSTVYLQDEKSYDYLVSYVKENIQKKAGELNNLTVSVILNKESLSDSKRQELTGLIANSAAIGSDKVVVYTDLFNLDKGTTTPDDGGFKNPFETYPWLLYAVIGAGALILIFIVLVLIISKKRKKRKKNKKGKGEAGEEATPAETPFSLDADQMEQIQDIKLAKGMVMKQKIQEFSQQNPEIAAQLVKSWLRGEDK